MVSGETTTEYEAPTRTPDDADEFDCPYLGLAPYQRRDRDLFFGRTHATAEFADLVREAAGDASGMVILIGASGAGKSSLLAAGLIPAVSDWDVTTVVPGPDPITALAAAYGIDGDADLTADDIVTALTAQRLDRQRLLIVDQFEEFFTACESESARAEFLAALHRCATEHTAAVVLALRADFYAHCLTYSSLQGALEKRSYILGPMRPDELAQAITGPARLAGLELEPGLDELIITDLCGVRDHHDRHSYDPGTLPLFSHALAATWRHRSGHRLTIAGYRSTGGIPGAVAATAEHAWDALTAEQQAAAAAVLPELVAIRRDARDIRRRAVHPDLLRRTADPDAAAAVLAEFGRARLISRDGDAVGFTHDIVPGAWPRLRGWVDAARVDLLTRELPEIRAAHQHPTAPRDHRNTATALLVLFVVLVVVGVAAYT
ncbi:hypothetical protein [Nocardia sp. CC227C]|uniref:nSTAND1 domain-containing NTPase n=1 Tax=Nocardia sp. CC227C TaxID=3044562 RepID=UPI00278C76C9|nr:hypothetical protein [Nocardia sp. CC227C]